MGHPFLCSSGWGWRRPCRGATDSSFANLGCPRGRASTSLFSADSFEWIKQGELGLGGGLQSPPQPDVTVQGTVPTCWPSLRACGRSCPRGQRTSLMGWSSTRQRLRGGCRPSQEETEVQGQLGDVRPVRSHGLCAQNVPAYFMLFCGCLGIINNF